MPAKKKEKTMGKTDWNRVQTMTDDEINRAIAEDPDTFVPTKAEWKKARPAREVLPPDLYNALVESSRRARGQRGPQKSPVKEQISIRLDTDVVEHFRSGGAGWQSRLNEALRDYISHHR